MKKEEIYINLQGKTKEELTDLWEFLDKAGEKQYGTFEKFLNCNKNVWKIYHLDRYNEWDLCKYDSDYDRILTEITIHQLKQIIKPMGTFTPIAMKCTQEQFDAVKPKLTNCKIGYTSNFEDVPYLVNNADNEPLKVYNLNLRKECYNRTVHETWNEEIFLKACGIEVETKFRKGDIVIITDWGDAYINNEYFTLNTPYKLIKDLESGFEVYKDNKGERNGYAIGISKTMKFELYKENTLEQQLQKAKLEVERLQSLIEEENKPKVGDICLMDNGIYEFIALFKDRNNEDIERLNIRKLTKQQLIEWYDSRSAKN